MYHEFARLTQNQKLMRDRSYTARKENVDPTGVSSYSGEFPPNHDSLLTFYHLLSTPFASLKLLIYFNIL